MSTYGEAIGLFRLNVGGFNKDLTPQTGDSIKLLGIMDESRKRNDQGWLWKQFMGFVKEVISRDYPPSNEQEKKELDMFVEFNILELYEEFAVAFRINTREDIASVKELIAKKVTALN